MVKTVLLALFLTSLSSLSSLAAVDERLPDSSIYKGEIRRGPDGRLMSIESAELPGAALKAASMIVGPQEKITSISEAAKLAKDGEVIEIRSGDYRGQPVVWTQNNLTIRGSDKRPVMLADAKAFEGSSR